ncbi:MAG: MFS transporter, partial [Anaerolineales bacterium]
ERGYAQSSLLEIGHQCPSTYARAGISLIAPPGSYALLSSAMGIGAVAGGLFIARQKTVSSGRLVGAALLFGLTVLAAAFMPSMVSAVAVLVLVGVASIGFISLGNSLLQLKSHPQMRGRVMSFWSMAFLGSSTIGGPIVGWFGEFIGPRWGLAAGGLAALAAAVLGWLAIGKPKIRKGCPGPGWGRPKHRLSAQKHS